MRMDFSSKEEKYVFYYVCKDGKFYKNTKPSSKKNVRKISEKEFVAFEKTVSSNLGKSFKVKK